MLPRLGVVDKPLLLRGRHLALLLLIFQPMQGAVGRHPVSDLQLTLFGSHRDALAFIVVHHRAFAALLDSFIASGEWLVHVVLLTDRQPHYLLGFNLSTSLTAFF